MCRTHGRRTCPDRSCRRPPSPGPWSGLWTGRPGSAPWGAACSGKHTHRHFNPLMKCVCHICFSEGVFVLPPCRRSSPPPSGRLWSQSRTGSPQPADTRHHFTFYTLLFLSPSCDDHSAAFALTNFTFALFILQLSPLLLWKHFNIFVSDRYWNSTVQQN